MRIARTSLTQFLPKNKLLLLVFVFLVIFPFLVGSLTDSSPYGVPRGDRMIMRGESVRWQSVMIEVYILAILTMSYNLLFGFTGIISFGHALFFGLGGYVLGLALEHTALDTGTGLIIGFAAGIGVCAVVAALIGIVTLRLRGVYFAIFTLALAEMGYIFFSRWDVTRAEDGFAITDLPQWLDPTQSRLTFYYLVLVVFVLTFLFIIRLVNSPTGAVFKAIRENEERAQAIGYNTLNYKLLSLVVAGTLAAIAGMLQILLNKKVGPEILGISYTVDPLLMTIIGGIGTFTGPVTGAASLHLLDIIFRDRTLSILGTNVNIADIWGLILGLLFILTVMVFPQGVVGTLSRWMQPGKMSTQEFSQPNTEVE